MTFEEYKEWCLEQPGVTNRPEAVMASRETMLPDGKEESGPPTLRSERGRVVISPAPKRSA